MKLWLIGALAVALVATSVPDVADAKRLGGSKSSGMQRNMPERTNPTPNSQPGTPAQPGAPAQTPGTPAAAPAGATAAAATAGAAAKRSWLGPIAGLAAGIGLVALMSSLGLGEEFANFLMLALLGVGVAVLVMFLLRRFAASKAQPALAQAGANRAAGGAQVAWPQQAPAQPAAAEPMARGGLAQAPAGGAADPVMPAPAALQPAAAKPAVPGVFVPAAFDSEGFARTAKMIFIRLQAANDSADLEDLRRFTTPELFASLRMDILERGSSPQHTDVQRVDAEVLDVADEDGQQVVSVRFRGEMVEEKGAAATTFDEVWHLVKPHDDSRSWAIAGIEQMS